MSDNLKILAERDVYSLTSAWEECLCLTMISPTTYELSIRSYERLAEASDYWCEEQDDYDLPGYINGKEVFYIYDDWVIGGLLVKRPYPEVQFKDLESLNISGWLQTEGWSSSDILDAISLCLMASDASNMTFNQFCHLRVSVESQNSFQDEELTIDQMNWSDAYAKLLRSN